MSSDCPVFDLDLIMEVVKASKTLIDKTTEFDTLIFLGQSPDYLSYIVKDHRHVISVPYSGRVYLNEYTVPSKENLTKYRDFLISLGITKKLLHNNENIIFVDHSHSGKTPGLFAKVLINCFEHDLTLPFKFINIVSNSQYNENMLKAPNNYLVNTIGFLLMPNLIAFANENAMPKGSEHTIPRTIPLYPFWKWDKPPNYSGLVEGKKCSQKLRLYYKFFDKIKVECEKLNNTNKKILLYFRNLLQHIVKRKNLRNVLNTLNGQSSKEELCKGISIILSDIHIAVSFRKKKYRIAKVNWSSKMATINTT